MKRRATPGSTTTAAGPATRIPARACSLEDGSAGARHGRLRRLAATAAAVAVLTLSIAACDDITGPTVTQRGILRFEPVRSTLAAGAHAETSTGPADVTDGAIEAPDQVRVGEAFTVTVSTVGLDGCWEPVDEDVAVEGLTAEIVPFDRANRREGLACTQALEFLGHAVQLSFDEVGDAVIRVEGRRVVGEDQAESEPFTLETTVTVVP